MLRNFHRSFCSGFDVLKWKKSGKGENITTWITRNNSNSKFFRRSFATCIYQWWLLSFHCVLISLNILNCFLFILYDIRSGTSKTQRHLIMRPSIWQHDWYGSFRWTVVATIDLHLTAVEGSDIAENGALVEMIWIYFLIHHTEDNSQWLILELSRNNSTDMFRIT